MTPMLFCNVGWMNAYSGNPADKLIGGGSGKDRGAERTNFKPLHDKMFGYVRVNGAIHLDKLGADKNAPAHSPIDVVWMAKRPEGGRVVVGWYREATGFRELQKYNKRLYRFTAVPSNCHLLDPDERHLEIEGGRKGCPGHNPIWYAQSPYGEEVKRKVEELIYNGQIFDRQKLNAAAKKRSAEDVPPAGFKTPLQKTQKVIVYGRCPKIHAYVLRRANGECERCNAPAPFQDNDNKPFLEVHHVEHLAEGGADQANNAVALCPNCHREAHYGSKRKEVRSKLKRKLKDFG